MAQVGADIRLAKAALDQGELVGIPTETVYGLAGNALNPKTVAKIFLVKQRPSFDPLIAHISSTEYLSEIVDEVPEKASLLIDRFWPGPLTLVLPKKSIIPDLVTSGLQTVAVRNPNHPLTLQLLNQLDYPLASPSANPFGYVSPTTAQHVANQLGNQIPYILDGGPCSIGIESTIVGFQQQEAVVLRPGGITLEDLEEVIGTVKVTSKSKEVAAPGMLESHYAPEKKLLLGDINELINLHPGVQVGILSFSEKFDQIDPKYQIQLSAKGNLSEAAQNLFGALRQLDTLPVNYIFAEPVPNHGLGLAINDRLQRASVKTISH